MEPLPACGDTSSYGWVGLLVLGLLWPLRAQWGALYTTLD